MTIVPGKIICMCMDVTLQGLLCQGPNCPSEKCPRGWGVLRAHGAPTDHLGWEELRGLPPRPSPGLRAASGWDQAFSTLFPCTQSVPESAPKEMKVVVPVSVCGPRDPPLWDLETIPASAFLGPLLPTGGVPALSRV